ncbi:PIG-L deacetylase family protein [Candidatus Contubernalis alkaliaceticus]|uniref:PIG-L deacetylase family protein n=1 Tax=Candidatus Contubernalis alkaliaceticus TaxID=338645 RepID=UPI001F4C0EE0|nr:PIG-L deacetylase family protein [Candidatus Contubernalis alkalaceticus]UNC92241.1 PIG-L family deacetylase [Candidatus Contubernalis alkalaceticus]
MKVLVFAPHPDDDLIGCGGSLAKHVKRGSQVTAVYMTSGDAGSKRYSKEKLAKIRENESREAAKLIGINKLIYLRNQDGLLCCNEKNIYSVTNIIKIEKPCVVYVPHINDGHRDHKKTNEIVIEAIKRAGLPILFEFDRPPWMVRKVLCYETWTPLPVVTFKEDISNYFELKEKALKLHKSQIENINHLKSIKKLYEKNDILVSKEKKWELFQVLKVNK